LLEQEKSAGSQKKEKVVDIERMNENKNCPQGNFNKEILDSSPEGKKEKDEKQSLCFQSGNTQ